MCNQKTISYFSAKTCVNGTQREGSFEYPPPKKKMFTLIDKRVTKVLPTLDLCHPLANCQVFFYPG